MFELRQENGKNNRIRGANFPYKKYLEDLSISDLPEDARLIDNVYKKSSTI